MAGVVGLEPTKWRDQNPLPYHLATPQRYEDSTPYILKIPEQIIIFITPQIKNRSRTI